MIRQDDVAARHADVIDKLAAMIVIGLRRQTKAQTAARLRRPRRFA